MGARVEFRPILIDRGDNEHAFPPKDSKCLCEKLFRILKIVDRFIEDHDVETVTIKRKVMGIDALDLKAVLIVALGTLNQGLGKVAPNDPSGSPIQITQPQSGTTGNLQDILAVTEIGGKVVSVKHSGQLVMGDSVSRDLRDS
jgi:hypothetical protein